MQQTKIIDLSDAERYIKTYPSPIFVEAGHCLLKDIGRHVQLYLDLTTQDCWLYQSDSTVPADSIVVVDQFDQSTALAKHILHKMLRDNAKSIAFVHLPKLGMDAVTFLLLRKG